MREILFRGKRIDKNNPANNGKWFEGVYFPEDDITPAIIYGGTRHNHGVFVDSETVGQYTGLTDKNGKRIFEGDIVRAKRINTDKSYLGDVIWWIGCFAIQEAETRNVPAIDLFYEYEVIGNIHDNPELL